MGETTSSRLLTLLSLLQGRRDWPGGELADRLEVSGRTIRRDVERLRELGYPVESMTGPAGGYQLRAGTAMPPLLLDDDEAIAIAVGLRTAAGGSVTGIEETSVRALVKLEQVLPSHLRRRVRALQTSTMTLAPAPGGPQVDPQHLTVIAAACRDHERVRFTYRARDDASTRREAEPHSLVNVGRRWYLVCFDCAREDWRTFRVDRMTRPATTGVRFEPRALPARDAAAYVAQSLSAAPARYEARVTVRTPGRGAQPAPLARRHRRADRRRELPLLHQRRQPRLAGHPDRDARPRVRGAPAARPGRAAAGDQRANHPRNPTQGDLSMRQRVSVITLGVRDLARARRFYEAVGWETGAAPDDDVVFFQAGDMVLALWDRERLAEDSCVEDTPGWGGVTLALNLGSPAEVDAATEEARAAGGTIGREPAETFWGGYSAVVIDPEGHPWEIAHNPHWTVTPEGGCGS